MSNLKNSPTFNPEGDNHGNWEKVIQVWEVLVGDEKKQHKAAVYLSLQGTVRDAVRSIDASV